MSNLSKRIAEIEADNLAEENQEWLDQLADEIRQTPTFGSKIIDRKWLEKNKEKIIRNKKLIDIIQ